MLATTRAARSQANANAALQRYAAYAAEAGSHARVAADAQAQADAVRLVAQQLSHGNPVAAVALGGGPVAPYAGGPGGAHVDLSEEAERQAALDESAEEERLSLALPAAASAIAALLQRPAVPADIIVDRLGRTEPCPIYLVVIKSIPIWSLTSDLAHCFPKLVLSNVLTVAIQLRIRTYNLQARLCARQVGEPKAHLVAHTQLVYIWYLQHKLL
jgi:hypothetical protein